MRRWNGWGDTTTDYPLPATAVTFLTDLVGPGAPQPDAPLADVVASVPPSRLAAHRLINQEPEVRLRHACGQSLPDWVAMRYGRFPAFPDGVAFPTVDAEVRELIQFAIETDARLIPYRDGTSVVRHINPQPGDAPVLT